MKTARTFRRLLLAASTAMLGASCAHTGFDDQTRADVSARVASLQAPLAGCYEQSLKRNRRLQGTMVISFITEAGSGRFMDVRVSSNELADPELATCVTAQVQTLKLAQPPKTQLAVDYPLHFAPSD